MSEDFNAEEERSLRRDLTDLIHAMYMWLRLRGCSGYFG